MPKNSFKFSHLFGMLKIKFVIMTWVFLVLNMRDFVFVSVEVR